MLTLIRGALRVSAMLFAVFLVCIFGLLPIRPAARAAAMPNDSAASADSAPTPEQVEFFEKKIRPALSQNCYSCHSAGKGNSGHLHLDDRSAMLTGGKSGPAIVPGNPSASLLIQRIASNDPDHRMPKDDDPLPASVIADFRAWIKDGAYWPGGSSTAPVAKPSAVVSGPKDQGEFFVKNVKPIFTDHCYACHSADTKPAAGLRVDTPLGLRTGGHSGAVFNVAKPEESLLLKRVLDPDCLAAQPAKNRGRRVARCRSACLRPTGPVQAQRVGRNEAAHG